MKIAAGKIDGPARGHWFLLAAAAVVTSDLVVASLDSWSHPGLIESGILFDLSVVVPALYLWCYRARGKAAIVRALGLSCLGIWLAGHIVPSEHHQVLGTVGFLRYIGLAVLIGIELKLVLLVFRAVFRVDGDTASTVLATAKDAGMPEWAARLMAWEASLWRRGLDWLRRMLGRR